MVQSQNRRTERVQINERTHHWTGREDTCMVCELGVRESVVHVMLEYNRYEEKLPVLRENIKKYNRNEGRRDEQRRPNGCNFGLSGRKARGDESGKEFFGEYREG